MAKTDASANLGELISNIYSVVKDIPADDRAKVLSAVGLLFGTPPPGNGTPPGNGGQVQGGDLQRTAGGGGGQDKTALQRYFAQKSPQNKGEMLAVAAKYREEQGLGQTHTVADFEKFFVDSRQNFDRGNFPRDIRNAQVQAHLFNKGRERGKYQLSYYGQQYVDALPDREAIKKLKRPGRKLGKSAKKKNK